MRETKAHSSYFVEGSRAQRATAPNSRSPSKQVATRCSEALEGGTYPKERARRAAHIPGGTGPGGSTSGLARALALPAVGERRLQS